MFVGVSDTSKDHGSAVLVFHIISIDSPLNVSHQPRERLCGLDEGVSDGGILRLGNSSNGNHRFLSCVKNAHKQIL
jgi:hypothetical protein